MARSDVVKAEGPGSRVGTVREPYRFTSLAGVVKFAATAAALAMVADAVVAHAVLWENDPYWTYWVTDSFLIATIFGVGTALFGAGIGRGAILTAVQTLVLTTYYWSLSPIGLPDHPEWLDLQHTWVTGVPVHFAVYYLGYLSALWLWRRHRSTVDRAEDVSADAGRALATGATVVVAVGVLQTVLLGEFPGVTWFIVRLVVMVPFTLAWWALAGRDRSAAVGGGIVVGILLTAYTHYLGPVGLPDTDLRVIAQDLPPSPVHWLSYQEEVLVLFPITVVVAVAAFLVASRWRGEPWTPLGVSSSAKVVALAGIVALVAVGAGAVGHTSTADGRATIASAGQAHIEDGAYYKGELVPAEGDLRLVAESRNTKRTPLAPHDRVNLKASVSHPDGTHYEVTATQAMVSDPLGRSGTWAGVGYDRWHHGRSGAGTSILPSTRSGVAVYALGELHADDELIATGVPMHVMTVPDSGVELHVGDPASPLPALPDGHLRVVWDQRDGDNAEAPEVARNLLGGALLIALLALAVAAVRSQEKELA